MPSIKWNVLLKNPITLLKILILASSRSTLVLLARIIFPFRYRKLTLRNALGRDWIRTAFQANSDIFCSEPWRHGCQEVVLAAGVNDSSNQKSVVGGWIVPSTEVSELKSKDAVILFAHGGGYAIGHGLQNFSMFKRLTKKAKAMGQDIAFVTVKYPLSIKKRWPAQRDSFMAMYEWLLDQGVPASKIVFSGTSAGGGLILLAMLYIRDHTSLPQPRCAIPHSPWTDVTSVLTGIKGHPLLDTDYINTYYQNCGPMNDILRPEGHSSDTPEISPILAADVSRLPPQLIFYGDAEILMTDSTRWIKRSRDAGVRIDAFVGKGEMHTFSNGWPVGGKQTEEECDEAMLTYIFTELAPPV
ncbi:hypothetical protein H2200_003309 [Cladophialophora chaetospira]|uniref:Alpha/beta hydrolase fold-3 domain-containing protein n=1 Tax=Cladophialophora chaetospira TaxID=386627 RepID=A0AA38XH71_9EURO|nr:hypothetical protein H2200_003309 [Cladophialophora chaetospira]